MKLGTIHPEEMPALAWDALEAGFDGPCIRRVAAMIRPSGWEVDQQMPGFMGEAGLKNIPLEEASIRVARQLASRILSERRDPLEYSKDFELIWIQSNYAKAIQDVGSLDDQKAVGLQTEAKLREYARSLLLELLDNPLP